MLFGKLLIHVKREKEATDILTKRSFCMFPLHKIFCRLRNKTILNVNRLEHFYSFSKMLFISMKDSFKFSKSDALNIKV